MSKTTARHLTCHEEIIDDDDGMLAPCGQHAVGRRFDPEQLERGSYPVCVEHVRAPMAVLRDEYGAFQRLRALCDDDEAVQRINQAVKLAAVDAPDALVDVAVKIQSRGRIYREDMVALERAGIELAL